MNTTDIASLVARCLESGTGLWVDTDAGELDLFGADLKAEWDSLAPGEGFEVLGVITEDVRKEL